MNYKKYSILMIVLSLVGLMMFAAMVWITDPFVQYHKPFKGMDTVYTRGTQAYVNAGLAKNYEYDSVIVGSSVSENFYASDFDEAFGCKTLKLPFAGGSTKTYSVILETVFNNRNVKNVFYSLDMFGVLADAAVPRYEMPEYLYNENIFDDVNYLLNKDVLNYVKNVASPHEFVSLDDAYNWNEEYRFSKERTLSQYKRPEMTEGGENPKDLFYNDVDLGMANVTEFAEAHGDTEFYVFYPPYSMLWFDMYKRTGQLDAICGGMERSMDILLGYDNVKVYCFSFWDEVVSDLDLYRESMHFSEDINKAMVAAMAEDRFRVTRENKEQVYAEFEEYVHNYDYDSLFDN